MKRKTVIMDENNMKRAVARITYEILERNKGTDDLCVVGIFSRGDKMFFIKVNKENEFVDSPAEIMMKFIFED